jgi:hypothetical protein
MKSLLEIIKEDNLAGTDKHSLHSYIPYLYDKLFESRREKKVDLLEIGVRDGASIRLWQKYFPNGKIYGIEEKMYDFTDKASVREIQVCIGKKMCDLALDRIRIYIGDAYEQEMADCLPMLDIIIDDGSHDLEDQKETIRLYAPKLKSNGILVIEDIEEYEYAKTLEQLAGSEDRIVEIHDFRNIKNRHDDIALTIKQKGTE